MNKPTLSTEEKRLLGNYLSREITAEEFEMGLEQLEKKLGLRGSSLEAWRKKMRGIASRTSVIALQREILGRQKRKVSTLVGRTGWTEVNPRRKPKPR